MLLFGLGLAIVAGASVGFPRSNDQELTIAIVDGERTTEARNEFRSRIAERMRAVLEQHSSYAMRAVYVGARDAKLKLNGGDYDAALVIGEDRPFWLRRMDLTTVAGSIQLPNGTQPVALIIGRHDAAAQQRLRSAFDRLLTPKS